MAYAKMRPRRGTLYEWTTYNPVIAEGELVIEHPNTGVGTGPVRFKIGDGFKPYNDLPYAFDALAANAIYGGNAYDWHDINVRSDSYDNWMSEDPVLGLGEIAYDKTHKKIKVGDGICRWSELTYIGPDFNHGDYDFGDENQIREDLGKGIHPKEPTPSKVVYRPRRGTKATMIADNVVLRKGEMFFEIPESGVGTDYCKVKIGDGVTPYGQLHYAIDPSNCSVEDLASELLVFDDTLTNKDIEVLLNKIKSKAKLSQIIENTRACIVWLKNKYDNISTDLTRFIQDVTNNYLTKIDAANVYLTKIDAAKTYVTKLDARKFVTLEGNQNLTNKTYEGYTLGDACKYGVSDSAIPRTFYNGEGEKLVTERRAYYGLPQFNTDHSYNSKTNYFVHTTPCTKPNYISVSSGPVSGTNTGKPIWKDPMDITVGKALKDAKGNVIHETYITPKEVDDKIPNDEKLKDLIKGLLPPNSILTPLEYHRIVHHRKTEGEGEIPGKAPSVKWFTISVPNAAIPYVDINLSGGETAGKNNNNTVTKFSKVNSLAKDRGYSHSSLIVLTISSTLEFGEYRLHDVFNDNGAFVGQAYDTYPDGTLIRYLPDEFRGMNDVLTYRMDHIMWSVRPRDGRITIGNNKKPLLRNIWRGQRSSERPWTVSYTVTDTKIENFSRDFVGLDLNNEEMCNKILYRNIDFKLSKGNRDVSVYIYRLDAPAILRHGDTEHGYDLSKPENTVYGNLASN